MAHLKQDIALQWWDALQDKRQLSQDVPTDFSKAKSLAYFQMEYFAREAGQQTQPIQAAQEQPHVQMAQRFQLAFMNTIAAIGRLLAKVQHPWVKRFMP